jgi:hypothetical protein
MNSPSDASSMVCIIYYTVHGRKGFALEGRPVAVRGPGPVVAVGNSQSHRRTGASCGLWYPHGRELRSRVGVRPTAAHFGTPTVANSAVASAHGRQLRTLVPPRSRTPQSHRRTGGQLRTLVPPRSRTPIVRGRRRRRHCYHVRQRLFSRSAPDVAAHPDMAAPLVASVRSFRRRAVRSFRRWAVRSFRCWLGWPILSRLRNGRRICARHLNQPGESE